MADDLAIRGGRQLDEFLKQFSAKVEANIMRGAVRAGANEFKAAVKANLAQNGSIDNGELAASVRVGARLRAGTVTGSLKIGNKKAYYWGWVEYGTRPHVIKAKQARGLLFGGNVVAEVLHPGAQPKPYARPALDEKAPAAVQAAAAYIRKRLTKEGIEVPDPGNDDEN